MQYYLLFRNKYYVVTYFMTIIYLSIHLFIYSEIDIHQLFVVLIKNLYHALFFQSGNL